jgi:cytoskeletal protein CcmA (bactofilin family)
VRYSPVVIPAHAKVDGTIETPSDLRIEGSVTGGIVCGGTVTVEGRGTCVAGIQAKSAVVHGEVFGNVTCSDSIQIGARARIVGDLRAPNIDVDALAHVDGRVDLAAPLPRRRPVQRLAVRARVGQHVRRPTVPPLAASRTAAVDRDLPTGSDLSDFSEFKDDQEVTTVRERSDELPGMRRAVPRAPRPMGKIRLAAKARE